MCLKPRVLDLLAYLVERQGRLVTKQELLRELWGERFVGDSVLTSCVYEARQALGESEGAERFIQTVHGRGYRFVVEVEAVDDGVGRRDPAEVRDGEEASDPVGRFGPSLAVLPFSDLSPGHDQDWFCEGLAEELIAALSAVRGLRVVSRSSTLQFRDLDPRSIGEKLRVETLLTGSVRRTGNRLRITTQLVQVADGSVLASSRYDREMEDVFAIQEAIARSVVEAVETRLGGRVTAPQPRRPTENVEAYHLYLKGRYHWKRRTPSALHEANRCFEAAIAIDPGFVLGYLGQADAHGMLGAMGVTSPRESAARSKALCLRALELEPDRPEVRRGLALLHAQYEWNWERAERELRAVLAVIPGDAEARCDLAIFALTPLGRFDEAVSEMRAALALDPVSPGYNTTLGFILYMARRFDEAERQLRATLGIDPAYPLALVALAETLAQLGRADEAVSLLLDRPAEAIENRGYLGAMLARTGRREEARAILAELVETRSSFYSFKVFAALIHAQLGELEPALDLLESSLTDGAPRLVWMGVRPIFDPLREHPHFQRMLERMRLPNVRPTVVAPS